MIHRIAPAAISGILLLLILPAVTLPGDQPKPMTIHVDRPGVAISPMLYGIFFEEINRAGDGGLYGEMLQNRSFEDDRRGNEAKPTKAPGWKLIKPQGATASIAIDGSGPRDPSSPHSLRLDIGPGQAAGVGVVNEGFGGMAVRKGSEYRFAMIARSAGGLHGPITVSLVEGVNALALATIEGVGPEWKRFDATLTATGTAVAQLTVTVASPGTLWLDWVSLFPKDTWKGRPNGLRTDLAEMLQAMRPAFVRFPGGCYVEGDRLPNAFRWKKTLGDSANRPGHWNLWGYRSTDGLGYHEYLQMCEDLGAEPLFVVNCGMSHVEQQHGPGKTPSAVEAPDPAEYLQDTLDAIEYANGPAESTWGSKRAAAGHPGPFHLKYLEIGNENSGPTYDKHYRLFYDAIHARYPGLHLVANTMTRPGPVEINDEHYYSSPEFFMTQSTRYDKYDRRGPKVYVGEYAVTQDCGKGNFRAALGEAAFMTGMERNSDVVVMASYAPLLVHVNWRQWNPNAIQFDASRTCGTPSYYVQKMFAQARGDVVLPVDFDAPTMARPGLGGMVGLGTWSTRAQFKDVRITSPAGDVLYQADFTDGAKAWKPQHGQWQAKEGILSQDSPDENCRTVLVGKKWKDYTYSLKARKTGGREGFLVLFNLPATGVKAWWNLGGWGDTEHGLELPDLACERAPGRIETDRWYDIRIEVQDARIRCFLDGELIHDVQSKLEAVYATASRETPSGDVLVKVVNAAAEAYSTEIHLAGLPGKVLSGAATVLTSTHPDDENTLEQPAKVVPVATPLPEAAARFRHTFPAYSVTVLQLKVVPK